jgi:hypothetical protein
MADFYPYLVSSLPMLHFGMKPPFSYERFLEVCRPLIPKKDFELLRALPKPEQYSEKGIRNCIILKWIEFDVTLRNELVRIRATKKHLDPSPYLLTEGSRETFPIPAGLAVSIHTSVPDAEKTLDEIRWKALEELALGHYFDVGVLITYAYKLMILQRWDNIRSADGMILLEQVLRP